jgi:hypothetical protein
MAMDLEAYYASLANEPEETEVTETTIVSEPASVQSQEEELNDLEKYYASLSEEETGETPAVESQPKLDESEVVTPDVTDELENYYASLSADVPTPDEDTSEYDLTVEKTFDEFAADQGYIDSIEEYAVSRYGKEGGARQEGETNAEYLERFLSEVRAFETNSIDLTSMIDWVRSASDEEKQNFGYVYSQLEKMPGFLSEGGGSALSGVVDYVGSFISDPLNLIGFGAGRVASSGARKLILETFKTKGKEAAIKEAGKLSLQAAKKPIAVEAASDLVTGTMEDLGRQTIEAEVGMAEDVSTTEAVIVGGLTAVLGGVATVGGTALGVKKDAKQLIDEVEAVTKALSERASKNEAKDIQDTGYVFDAVNGREILEGIDLTTGTTAKGAKLTQAELQVEITKRITKVATEVVADMLQEKKVPVGLQEMINNGAKASEVARVVLSGENIDSTILDGAIARAGMSVKDFLDVSGVSLTDAAKTMNAYSEIGKLLKRVNELDPVLAKELNDSFGSDKAVTGLMSRGHDFMMRLDRERRAFMVTQIATTARNVATAGMRLGMESAANFVESSLYHLGKSASSIARGEASVTRAKAGLKAVANDTFGTLAYLMDAGASKQLTEHLLKYNPRLARIMDRTLQEVDVDQTLSRPARFFNTLNMIQDGYFRRAIFNETVNKELRRVGMNMDDFIASGKALPPEVLQRGVDEALSFTFARMPKAGGEKAGDTIGHYFVKFNEALGPLPGVVGAPVGTGAFPFARFMVNAMQFQLEYSPLSAVGSIYNGSKGMFNKYVKGLSDATTEKQLRKAREQFGKATVGTAALLSAIKYREENQDTEWYNILDKEGRPVDTRAFFPISPYLAVADFIVKLKNNELDEAGIKQVMEGLTGAQLRSGASSYMIDSFFQNLSDVTGGGDEIKTEKMAEYIGGYLGELVGAFTTPAKIVNDVVAQFDKSAAVVRDARQIEGVGAAERGVDAFEKAALRSVPFLNQRLPEKESPTQEEAMVVQSPLLGQVTGVRPQQRKSDIQKELTDLGYADYEIVPSTGDKAADAYVKKIMGKFVESSLAREISLPSYQRLSPAKKKAAMRNKLSRYRDISKKVGKAEASRASRKAGQAFTAFDRAEWSKLSGNARKLADEYYQERYGMSVMEKQEQEPRVNHFLTGKKIGQQLNRVIK